MLLLVSLLLRLKSPIGCSNYLPYLKSNEVRPFLSDHEQSIGFFAPPGRRIDFANYAISRFGSRISFFIAPMEEGKRYKCKSYPCVRAFRYTEAQKLEEPFLRAVDFTLWVKNAFSPPVIKLTHPEHLRLLFETHGVTFIGIDMNDRPSGLSSDQKFYSVPRAFLPYFNITAQPGLYYFDSADRILHKVTGSVRSIGKRALVDFSLTDISSKPFFGGIFKDKADADAVSLLSSVATEAKNFSLGLLEERMYRANYVTSKYFLFMDHEGRRWYKPVNNCTSEDLLAFLKQIELNQTQPNLISDNSPNATITAANFYQKLTETGKDNVVLLVNGITASSNKFEIALKELHSIFPIETVSYHYFDVTKNDIPFAIGTAFDIPSMFIFKQGRETDPPVIYDGIVDPVEILEFISSEGSARFPIPEINESDFQSRVRKAMYPHFQNTNL